MERVVEIVRSRIDKRPAVVASAVSKTTDELISLAKSAAAGDAARVETLVEWIVEKHRRILQDLGLESDAGLLQLLEKAAEELRHEAGKMQEQAKPDKQHLDRMMSWGEYLSCNILASCLRLRGIPAQWIDARRLFITDSRFGNARPQFEESKQRVGQLVSPQVERGTVVVTQGFIGADSHGRTTTFGRGGSDYSATFLGALMDAEAVEIWTDVDGVMTADPSLVSDVHRIKQMTFEEAAELAYFGAKVLHPSTILPAVEQGIPVWVLNSMRSGGAGTEIVPRKRSRLGDRVVVKSIAYKEHLTVVNIKSTRMLMAYGFLAGIFEVFNRFETPVDLVSTSEVSVSVTIDNLEKIDEILRELSRIAEVELRHGQAVVCLVGQGVCRKPGLVASVFSELEGIQVNLISQGASEVNISFVINESDLPEVISRLHRRFFGATLDEEIFD